jgi:lipopolysaccharide export system protein LptC
MIDMQWPSIKYLSWLAVLLGSCLFVISCENDLSEVDSQFSRKTAIEEAFQVESYLSQNGVVKGKLTAPYMQRYLVDSPYVEFPRTLHVDFYNDSTRIESILDAHYAKFLEFQHKILLLDSVVIINKVKGDTLRTSELWWDQDKQEFTTDKPVWINTPDQRLYNKSGMRAAQDFSWWDLFSTSGDVDVKDNGDLQ